jgi:hypothetical protein
MVEIVLLLIIPLFFEKPAAIDLRGVIVTILLG